MRDRSGAYPAWLGRLGKRMHGTYMALCTMPRRRYAKDVKELDQQATRTPQLAIPDTMS